MTAPVFPDPLEQLIAGVKTYLASAQAAGELGAAPEVLYGHKERSKQINQGFGRANRVVFLPSRPEATASTDQLVNPHQVGDEELDANGVAIDPDNPSPIKWTRRPLADLRRVLAVSVWAYDGAHQNEELKQDVAVRTLLMWTMRAVNAVAFGNAQWGAAPLSRPLERTFGVELVVDLVFQHPIYDAPLEIGQPEHPLVQKDPSS